MLRILPVLALFTAVALAGCLVQPAPEPSPTTVIEVPQLTSMPTPATPTPMRVNMEGSSYIQYGAPPLLTIDPASTYTAVINTNQGTITLELYPEEAPQTVNNFVFLAKEGFYNGVTFHRVIPNFMIQGGDPTGTGARGPGYQFGDEIAPGLVFDSPGVLAMANSGPDTNGSQFFITVASTPDLTGSYAIFGRVTDGQDVADAISIMPTNNVKRPLTDVVISSIDITKDDG